MITISDFNQLRAAAHGRTLVPLGVACLLVIAFVFAVYPIDDAWAKRVNTQNYDNYQRERGASEMISHGSVSFDADAKVADYSFSDEASGVILSHYPQDSSDLVSESGELIPPYVEHIDLQRGEECLHAEGACDACDKLREMYRYGEVDALCRATITPEIVSNDRFYLSVPLDTRVEKYTYYRCDGTELKSGGAIGTAKVAEEGFAAALIMGDSHAVQSPFGIAYNKSMSSESTASETTANDESTKSSTMSVHAYTPDDDEDDEAEWLKILASVLEFVVGIAVISGVMYLLGLIWYKIKHPKER